MTTDSPRRSRDELRSILVAAGRSVIGEEGLGVGAGALTFKRAFDHLAKSSGIRLTNASIIRRVWDNQEEFRTDVLVAIASMADSSGELDRTAASMVPLLDSLDLSTPDLRLRALCELARVGGEVGMRSRLETRDWSLWVGVWVLALTTPVTDRRTAILTALEAGLESAADVWEQLFEAICAHLGLRVRSPLTVREFTLAVSALAEGSALRQGGDPELEIVLRPTGPDGALEEWTLFGVGLDALARRFLEVAPGWHPADTAA